MTAFMADWRITAATLQSLEVTVAEQNGHPVAFSGVAEQQASTLHIEFLFVAPEAQGRGIGNLLLTRAEDAARAKRLARLTLESDPHAVGFYEQNGFQTLTTRLSEMVPGKAVPLMEKLLTRGVHVLSKITLRRTNTPWRFEKDNEAEIAAHFAEAQKKIALLWNGRTLKLTGYRFENGIFEGTLSESSYAAHLTWRDWGAPDATAFNLFGSAIIRSRDGALLYGVMAPHTATAGQIYPPGGNLDLNDVTADGKVDILGAIERELEEETGQTAAGLRKRQLLIAFDGARISVARVFDSPEPAAALRQKILDHSKASEEQELSDIVLLRRKDDLVSPAIAPFARELAEHLLRPDGD